MDEFDIPAPDAFSAGIVAFSALGLFFVAFIIALVSFVT